MPTISTKNYCLNIFFFFLLLHPSLSNGRKLLSPVSNAQSLEKCQFDKIYQFGDSISDTGNLVAESPYGSGFLFNKFPYGITFGKPTGRCSNGLLMIDYFASAFGLPYLDPYEKHDGASFKNGVNFAVAGSTALPVEVLKSMNIPPGLIATNSSLSVQLQWMASHLNHTCQNQEECQKMLKNSLFMVGEIGGNDYNYALVGNRNADELNSLVPEVVQSIVAAVERVISFGATKIVVPGNFPIGCLPIYLSSFPSNNAAAYDSNQCLIGLNGLAVLHNEILKAAIEQLKNEYPNTAIVYADYFNAFLSVLSDAQKLGFEEKFSACCGFGGPHNFSMDKLCGMPGVTACPNPDNHISWDGIHMTQQAYKFMAEYLIKSISPQLQCS